MTGQSLHAGRLETVGNHLARSVLRAAPDETVEHARARMLADVCTILVYFAVVRAFGL